MDLPQYAGSRAEVRALELDDDLNLVCNAMNITPIVEVIVTVGVETAAESEARSASERAFRGQFQFFALALGFDNTNEVTDRLLYVCSAMVEDYCSEAPDAIRTEAVIRMGGWLKQTPVGNIVSSEKFSGEDLLNPSTRRESEFKAITYAPGMTNAFVHSGAKSLLSPFKRRRAMSLS